MFDSYKVIAFAAMSAVLAHISRAPLRAPRSHGFYRFFAWELILALILINIDVWFSAPWSWRQLISWFLLPAVFGRLVFGVRALTGRRKPVEHRKAEPQLLAFERTSSLVTSGIYRYIRHPL